MNISVSKKLFFAFSFALMKFSVINIFKEDKEKPLFFISETISFRSFVLSIISYFCEVKNNNFSFSEFIILP